MKTSAKKGLPIFLIVIFTLAILEATSAVASRKFNFSYAYLTPVAFLAYGLVSYLITQRTDKKTGIVYAAGVGLFDATVGWWVSTSLSANTGDIRHDLTLGIWLVTAIIVTATASLFGLFGAWLATRKSRTNGTNR